MRLSILFQFGSTPETARVQYAQFVTSCNNVTQKDKQLEIIDSYIYNEPYEYCSQRFIYYRDLTPEKVIGIVAEAFDIQTPDFIKIKYNHSVSQFKAISVFLMRCLIILTKISVKSVEILHSPKLLTFSRGFALIQSELKFKNLLPQLLEKIKVA
ncbi:MAG: hypothetical protein ACOWWR_07430 [Eubacteriales bacterium]